MKPVTKQSGLRTDSQPIVAVIEPGLIRRDRVHVPLWVTLTGLTLRLFARLILTPLRIGVRYWPATLVLLAAAWLWRRLGGHGLFRTGVLAVLTLGALLAWPWVLRPVSFAQVIGEPARGLWRWHRVYRGRWREAMDGCGLIVRHDDTEYLPQVESIRANGTVDTCGCGWQRGRFPRTWPTPPKG